MLVHPILPGLRRHVRSVWSHHLDVEGVQPGVIPADGLVEFVFHLGAPAALQLRPDAAWCPQPRAFVLAMRKGLLRLSAGDRYSVLAMRLEPVVASVILRRPLAELWDRVVPLVDLIGPAGDHLHEQLCHTPAAYRPARLQQWLLGRLAPWTREHERIAALHHQVFWHTESDSLASEVKRWGVTERSLRRWCAQSSGLAPKQWSISGRLLRACVLLRGSSARVSDVAQDCGFHDHAALTHAFGAAYGMTPSQFRSEPLVFLDPTIPT